MLRLERNAWSRSSDHLPPPRGSLFHARSKKSIALLQARSDDEPPRNMLFSCAQDRGTHQHDTVGIVFMYVYPLYHVIAYGVPRFVVPFSTCGTGSQEETAKAAVDTLSGLSIYQRHVCIVVLLFGVDGSCTCSSDLRHEQKLLQRAIDPQKSPERRIDSFTFLTGVDLIGFERGGS